MNHKSFLPSTLVAAVALATLASAGSAHAQTYMEGSTDAGQTLTTAPAIGTAGTSFTSISGNISGSSADADLYRFTISAANPTFSATVSGGTSSVAGNGPIDTSLFLFDMSGRALFANDDQSNTNYQGALLNLTLAPGTYYLGISLSGNEPVNSANQMLFTVDQPTTSVRGPASGVNPTTESTFDSFTYVNETGPYSVAISAVPEPSTWMLTGMGALALGVTLVRRNRQTSVVSSL